MLGAALIIGGSGAMNNFIDQDINPIMKRPTVTGRFKPSLVLAIALSFLFVGEILLFAASFAAGMWGLAGIFAFNVVLYSMWSKRNHVSNTVVGSISGALALFLIMFAWQPPHFFVLAMQRTKRVSCS